jgi:hypothetical protein
MEDLIIKDFETSVQNSAEAEELFGDTTDDIIAVANQHGFIEKIPILGWVVKTVNVLFPASGNQYKCLPLWQKTKVTKLCQ